jgi:hypothetical protein
MQKEFHLIVHAHSLNAAQHSAQYGVAVACEPRTRQLVTVCVIRTLLINYMRHLL